jgi:hypothetical protein
MSSIIDELCSPLAGEGRDGGERREAFIPTRTIPIKGEGTRRALRTTFVPNSIDLSPRGDVA